MRTLREETVFKFSLGMLLILGSGLVAMTTWLVVESGRAEATEKRVDSMEKVIRRVDHRLSRIEGALDVPDGSKD